MGTRVEINYAESSDDSKVKSIVFCLCGGFKVVDNRFICYTWKIIVNAVL